MEVGAEVGAEVGTEVDMQVGTELDMGEVDVEEHRDRRGNRHEGRNKSKYGNINESRPRANTGSR